MRRSLLRPRTGALRFLCVACWIAKVPEVLPTLKKKFLREVDELEILAMLSDDLDGYEP